MCRTLRLASRNLSRFTRTLISSLPRSLWVLHSLLSLVTPAGLPGVPSIPLARVPDRTALVPVRSPERPHLSSQCRFRFALQKLKWFIAPKSRCWEVFQHGSGSKGSHRNRRTPEPRAEALLSQRRLLGCWQRSGAGLGTTGGSHPTPPRRLPPGFPAPSQRGGVLFTTGILQAVQLAAHHRGPGCWVGARELSKPGAGGAAWPGAQLGGCRGPAAPR